MWLVTRPDFIPSAPSKGQHADLSLDGHRQLPFWIMAVYGLSNFTLNSLNVLWFSKMIRTIVAKDHKSNGKRQ